jgi:hypothetical protein
MDRVVGRYEQLGSVGKKSWGGGGGDIERDM